MKIIREENDTLTFDSGEDFKDFLWERFKTINDEWAPGSIPFRFNKLYITYESLNISSVSPVELDPDGTRQMYWYLEGDESIGGYISIRSIDNVEVRMGRNRVNGIKLRTGPLEYTFGRMR